jgi:hypothetical protein
MTPFDDATAITPVSEGTYAWTVPDGWQQGRGAWGGLVVAALVRSVVASETDLDRTIRTVNVQMMAPALVGPHVITTRHVRRGSGMSTWSAVATHESGVVATMVAITGSARDAVRTSEGRDWGTAVAPAVLAAADVASMPMGPPMPVFMQHLDFRPVSGLPLSGGPAETIGWLALRDPPRATAATLLALADAWWPATLSMLAELPRMATVNFTANLLVDPASVDEAELLLNQSFVTAAADGFASEHRRLWTSDGRLAVDNVQTMVIGS